MNTTNGNCEPQHTSRGVSIAPVAINLESARSARLVKVRKIESPTLNIFFRFERQDKKVVIYRLPRTVSGRAICTASDRKKGWRGTQYVMRPRGVPPEFKGRRGAGTVRR